ncbi:ComEC/Rec2 family competence protein [Candidatus Saccharibacteria bacterium]|nr:ComEC/Rec2 family competence protein [Candidatus Saccharibacteria bacterium]
MNKTNLTRQNSPTHDHHRKTIKTFLNHTIHQSYFVVALATGIITGTILGIIFRINFFASPLWLVFTTLLFIYAYFHPTFIFMAITFTAGLILSFFRITTELQGEDYIRNLQNQTVIVTGTIDSDPNQDEEKGTTKVKLTNLVFSDDKTNNADPTTTNQATANQNATPHQITGTIYATLRQTTEIKRTDRITLKGELLQGFGTYAGYLYQPNIIKIEHQDPPDWILQIRNWFADRIKTQLDETEANLGLSYLLGMKTNLDPELSDNLRIVGLVHIVVASGAHLSILVEVTKKLFGKLSRFSALLFSILFILFFMAMVGWTPSILRAGIMSILTLSAWYVGRKFAPWRIILLVASITLIMNPMFIINLGWLLSFASFAGIMILGPKLTKFFYGDKQPKFIASTIITTISATLMTLPITLFYYGTASLISVLANLLILPTLPYAMGLTLLSGIFANIPAIGFITTKLLDFHIGTVNFFAEAKSFLVEIDAYQPQVFVIYLIIVIPFAFGLLYRHRYATRQHRNGQQI